MLAWLLAVAATAAGGGEDAAAPTEPPIRPFFFALSVADVESSAAWYRRVLGFRPARSIDLAERGVKIRLLDRDGAFLELVEDATARPPAEVDPALERRFRVHGVFKVGFLVDDLDHIRERLVELDVPLRGDPFTEPDGSMRSLQIEDPDGNVIQLFEIL